MLLYIKDSSASYDFVHHDDDPTPEKYSGEDPDDHGTMCAGVIGMVKNNHHCGVGVAYNAKVGGNGIVSEYYGL